MNKLKVEKPRPQNICNAGEYYIASILSANGFTTTITLGRAEKYDILAINPKGKPIKIQVKTLYGKWYQWRMSEKHEKIPDNDIFFAFVRLNNMEKQPEYWIVPIKWVAFYVEESHKKFKVIRRKDKKKHNPTKAREFRIKPNKYSPSNWEEICKKYVCYNGIDPLLD